MKVRGLRWLRASVMGIVLALTPATSSAQSMRAARDAAVEGGVILVCRHAITGSFREREPVDYDDPSTQRQLNAEGEQQSRRMGNALRSLGVDVTRVVASPMHRAYRTAELMYPNSDVVIDSVWHTNGSDYEGPAREARRRFLSTRVDSGSVLVVSHIGTMRSVLSEARGVGEGDCLVVRPEGATYDVVGVVGWRDWLGDRERGQEPERVERRMREERGSRAAVATTQQGERAAQDEGR